MSDSVTIQPLAESNLSIPFVNFTPLSEDRGLLSYPLQRLSSSCLTVSGPSTAVTAVSDPSVVYCPTSSDPNVVCRPTSGTNAVSVTTSGPSAVRVNDSGPSAVCRLFRLQCRLCRYFWPLFQCRLLHSTRPQCRPLSLTSSSSSFIQSICT